MIDYNAALKLMNVLQTGYDNIEVFTDRGWGDDPQRKRAYHIIIDGNGQEPVAEISKETFQKLRKNGFLGENILETYKARTLHAFIEGGKK